MGVLDSIFGSEKGPAVPGGNVAKPLMIALLALLASRYMAGGGQKELPTAPPQDTAPIRPASLVALAAYLNGSRTLVSAKASIPGSRPDQTKLSHLGRLRRRLVLR